MNTRKDYSGPCGLCGSQVSVGLGPQLVCDDPSLAPVCRECGQSRAQRLLDLLRIAEGVEWRESVEEAVNTSNQVAIAEYDRVFGHLVDLTQALGSARDLTQACRTVRDFVLQLACCSGIVICLFDAERQERTPVYAWTDNQEVSPTEFVPVPVGNGPTGYAIRAGAVVISDDYMHDLRIGSVPVRIGTFKDSRLPNSVLIAPMISANQTLGCIEIQTYERHVFGQEHALSMQTAAALIAGAIEELRSAELLLPS